VARAAAILGQVWGIGKKRFEIGGEGYGYSTCWWTVMNYGVKV